MEPQSKSNGPTSTQVLRGGQAVKVTDVAGKTHEVFVRQVRPSQLEDYLQKEGSGEVSLISFVTGVEPAEVDEWTLESFEAVVEENHRQNFSAARSRERRLYAASALQQEAMRTTMPNLYAEVMAGARQRMNTALGNSSVTPSSVAASGGRKPKDSQSPS